MRANCFVRGYLLAAALVAFSLADTSNASPAAPAGPMAPLRGMVSVAASPAAVANLTGVSANPALRFVDGFLTPEDMDKLQKGERPDKRHYVVIVQPTDDKLRFATPDTFAALVGDMRKSFLGPAEISRANAHMASNGEGSTLLNTKGDRILVDETNCFAVVTQGKFEVDGNTKLPPMNMGVAYVRLNGQFYVVKIFAKGTSAEESAWLTNEVPAWLHSLVAKN
jgi:hypothetical protein